LAKHQVEKNICSQITNKRKADKKLSAEVVVVRFHDLFQAQVSLIHLCENNSLGITRCKWHSRWRQQQPVYTVTKLRKPFALNKISLLGVTSVATTTAVTICCTVLFLAYFTIWPCLRFYQQPEYLSMASGKRLHSSTGKNAKSGYESSSVDRWDNFI